MVPFEWGDTGGAEAVCLEPHDLVLAKLVAGREKDYEFANALIGRGLVDASVLLGRVDDLSVVGAIKRRIRTFIEKTGRHVGSRPHDNPKRPELLRNVQKRNAW